MAAPKVLSTTDPMPKIMKEDEEVDTEAAIRRSRDH